MKLACENKYVESYGEQESSGFSIKASAKAFKILSDGLYSDKIMAVVRELCCNAYDSHVASKNTEQTYDVQLPTTLEPQFSIRDYGTGLSHEDVMQLYTTYFESTKSDTNDYIGALGLGSKSPFSYVDQFMVESWYGGKHRTYSAFIGKDGAPNINLMSTMDSDEPNGLKVTVAVKDNDINVFKDKLKATHAFTEMKPNVLGQDFEWDSITIEYGSKDLGWVMYKSEYRYNTIAYAIQGGVAYPLNYQSIYPDNYTTEPEKGLLKDTNIALYFNMGDLDVAASREELSYDRKTVKNIKSRLRYTYESLLSKYYEEVEKEKTLHAAYLRAEQVYNNSPYVTKKVLCGCFKYRGIDYHLNESFKVVNKFSREVKKVELSKLYYRGGLNYRVKTEQTYQPTKEMVVPFSTKGIIIDDVKGSRSHQRIKEAYDKGTLEKGYYLLVPNEGNVHKWVKSKLGSMPIVGKLSDYTLPEKITKGVVDNTDINFKVWCPHRCWGNDIETIYRSNKTIAKEGGFYVDVYKNKVVDDTIKKKYLICNELLDIGQVYCVASTYKKKIRQLPNWVNLSDYLDKAIPVILSNIDRSTSDRALVEKHLTDSQKDILIKIKGLTTTLKPVTILHRLLESKDNNKNFHLISKLYSLVYDKEITKTVSIEKETKVKQLISSVFDKAELLDSICINRVDKKKLLNYLELVNK